MEKITITRVFLKDLSNLQILFAKYQNFYGAKTYAEKNHNFLSNILDNEQQGIFHMIYCADIPIGFSGVYFSYSSVSAEKIAIINDLFIRESYRKKGYGKALITHIIDFLKKQKFQHIRWCTASDNQDSQKLYDNFAANKSNWVHYDLKQAK